jgi:hypothetical protein
MLTSFKKKGPMVQRDGSVQGFHFVYACILSQTPTNQPAQNSHHQQGLSLPIFMYTEWPDQ